MLYSYKNQYPNTLPFRIVLSDGRTRTDPSSFTEEEIADAGLVAVDNPPTLTEHQTLSWSGTDWVVITKTAEQIEEESHLKLNAEWNYVREMRDRLMFDFEWRYTRHERETRLGLPTTDQLEDIDTYMQALADITNQPDPFNIVWPQYGEDDLT